MSHTLPALRTPYHALGDGTAPRVPDWATHRSVYRSSGRTLYLVETDRFDAAQRDLATLSRVGWHVAVDRSGSNASIALSRIAA